MDIWHRVGRIVRFSNLGTLLFFTLNILLIVAVFGSSGSIVELICIYFFTVAISLSPLGEMCLAAFAGASDIKRVDIKLRVVPLVQYVLDKAKENTSYCPKKVKVKIIHDPAPNAFALGRQTLCITDGLLLLSDDMILGILAHEIGHLSYGHTVIQLLIGGGNIFISGCLLLIKISYWIFSAIMGLFAICSRSGVMGIITAVFAGISTALSWLWVKFCMLFLMWSIFRTSLKEKPADGDGDTLPDFTKGQTFGGAEVAVTEHFTQPPKPYSEDTLLSAMENAGKDDIPDEAERKGLGTPATRAAIIEKLVAAGFVERKGKSLIPTKAGINLVTVLPEPLTSPMLTAEWEQKLTEIAKGGADPDTFMDGIRTMVQEIVSTYSCISEDGKKLFAPEKEVIGTCPRCGQPVYEGKKNFACSDRSCGFVLWKNDRFWTSRKKELTKKMATDLLKKGRTNVKGMWSEKKQAAYDAAVILDDTGGKYINFKLEFPKRKEGVNGRK